jgi:hypothetical protein
MKSRATTRFWKLYDELPSAVQKLADKNYELWKSDPHHPSLHFKLLGGYANRFSVRVGDHYRAIGQKVNDGIEWVWIGSHADYDLLLKRR